MGTRNRLSVTLGLFAVALLFASVQSGGVGGCGSGAVGGSGGGDEGGDDEGTRSLTGALPVSLPAPLTLRGKSQTTLACADTQVCCAAYDGSTTAMTVGSDCAFSLDLPINNFYYCGLFTGEDADGNGCGDEYLASLGCSENSYSGAIPIYPDADGSTGPIDMGTGSVEGAKVVSTGDACGQVDQDGDGIADAGDTDDDDDGTADGEDNFNKIGCGNLDELDSDGDHVPDLFQGSFRGRFAALLEVKYQTDTTLDQFFLDEDGDGVPDGCDNDFGCEPVESDLDGNCLPDEFEYCTNDADGDGLDFCFDCDDSNPDLEASIACYDDFCKADADGDGFGLCQDCNDKDPTVQYNCFANDYCSLDQDLDGFPLCIDCNDRDATVGATECHPTTSASTSSASTDYCERDNDGDGVNVCSDCYDFDASVTTGCFAATDVCLQDNDGDGYGFCVDCNDGDSLHWVDCASTTTAAPCTAVDGDGDGFNRCNDCNDADPAITTECFTAAACAVDADRDGYRFCQDCNDEDPGVAMDCHGTHLYLCGDAMAAVATGLDQDHDGLDFCWDCNDKNSTILYCP